jgi:hypothetical protein
VGEAQEEEADEPEPELELELEPEPVPSFTEAHTTETQCFNYRQLTITDFRITGFPDIVKITDSFVFVERSFGHSNVCLLFW